MKFFFASMKLEPHPYSVVPAPKCQGSPTLIITTIKKPKISSNGMNYGNLNVKERLYIRKASKLSVHVVYFTTVEIEKVAVSA
jgi:hypothetical protein